MVFCFVLFCLVALGWVGLRGSSHVCLATKTAHLSPGVLRQTGVEPLEQMQPEEMHWEHWEVRSDRGWQIVAREEGMGWDGVGEEVCCESGEGSEGESEGEGGGLWF